uniref:Uncharacterized protein n=1 Tax=Pyramimonas parkeae TaxID=36894 RepID=A0A1R7T0Q6_9CHLO|nr:hypothetical protein [Pyramimonas parkeae]
MFKRFIFLVTLLLFLLTILRDSWIFFFLKSAICLCFILLEGYQGKKEKKSYRYWYSTEEFESYGQAINFGQWFSRLFFLLVYVSILFGFPL